MWVLICNYAILNTALSEQCYSNIYSNWIIVLFCFPSKCFWRHKRRWSLAMLQVNISVSSKIPQLIVQSNAKFNPKKMLIGAAHNGQICSTWGNFHFHTFDGNFFQLPYTCNYILTTMCDSTLADFNIQMRREYTDGLAKMSSFTIKLEGIVIMLYQGNLTINNEVWVLLSLQRQYKQAKSYECICWEFTSIMFPWFLNSKPYCLYVMFNIFLTTFKQIDHPRLLLWNSDWENDQLH